MEKNRKIKNGKNEKRSKINKHQQKVLYFFEIDYNIKSQIRITKQL